jgi:hypothetical protein
MEAEELLKYMQNFFSKTNSNLQIEINKLSQKDSEISDVLHYIEIHSLKAYELAKVCKLLKTLREERRQIKNNIEVLEIFDKFAQKYNNKLITGDIMQALKSKKQADERHQNPTYKYRTDVLDRLK